jgi:oligopeptide/dipeptide ABC transporter ATP-binding protein
MTVGASTNVQRPEQSLQPVLPGDPTDRGGKAQPMLIVENLKKYFPIRAGLLNRKVADARAVDGVSFTVLKGETLGIVGESGCGKSTLAKLLMHLVDKDEGKLIFDGEAIDEPHGLSLRDLRRNMQMVFHESYSSLNPRLPVEDTIAYGPRVHGQVVEIGPVDDICSNPQHRYTTALLNSRLSMNPAERVEVPPLAGDPPNPINPPSGCRFRTRCPFAEAVCETKVPTLAKG